MRCRERYSQIRITALAILLLTYFSQYSASGIQYPASSIQKLDPVLKPLLLNQGSLAPSSVLLRGGHPAFPGVSGTHESDLISAIIKVTHDPMSIEASGARVRTVMGNIVTADVPLRSVGDLVSLSNVVYIQSARRMQPAMLDVSVPDTRADQVWRSVPGYTGRGVIVGIIDEGIDWQHPDFKGEDGTSRVLYIWDQTVQTSGHPPAGYNYGTEWTKAHIDSGQCHEMDATSHGTHVASIIAGNGRGVHEFTGMAPEADIIVVKTNFGSDADLLDAADYIFRRAAELKRPAVINMSFGSHWGPHDGTDLLDQAVDKLLGLPGRAIVAAAGNDGNYPIHAGMSALRRPVGGNYPWTAISPTVGAQSIEVQIWYPPGKSLSLRLLLPENENGDLSNLGMGWFSSTSPKLSGQFREFLIMDGPLAGARVLMDYQPASPLLWPNFDSFYIRIYDDGDLTVPIDRYIYAIEYDGAGVRFDAYVVWGGKFTTKPPESGSFSLSEAERSYFLAGDDNSTVATPSSAAGAICVGSYVTKSEWVDSENRIRSEGNLKIDDISVFSSRGPLLNGALKPEIAAPGEMVVAAFSSGSWSRARSIYRDGSHVSFRGTSMSSPHVTGAVALIYQQNPNLTASAVKDMLIGSAIDRGSVGWDRAWGYGKLDVLAAMGIPAAPEDLNATVDDDFITVQWLPNQENDIVGYRIYSMLDAGYSILDITTTSFQYPVSSIKRQVSLSVSAYDTAGNEGPKSRQITVVTKSPGPDVIPPEPPREVTVTSINTVLDLKWSLNDEYDLSGYRIYYGTSSGIYDVSVDVGNLTEYRLSNLTNGVRFYVAVSAIDTSGNESAKSAEVSDVPQLFRRSELRYQSGWPVSVEYDVYSSPAFYDIDSDGRLEVAISARDGNVYLLRYDGRDMPGWPISTDSASVSSPALADVDGDGRAEIAVGSGEMVYIWHDDGMSVHGWPVKMGGRILAAPALGDIDGDGRLEVVAGSRDGRIYAYNNDGSLVDGWPVITRGYVNSSAALGDIDSDSRLEVVIGSVDGNLYVFNGDGTAANGWPVYVGAEMNSSPVLGDIDGDGSMEIALADSLGWVYVWRNDGKLLKGWPVSLRDDISSSPALGDIDNDKTLEIVIGTENGSVYVLKSDGAAMGGWPISVMSVINSSPALGDVDSDGAVDIIIAAGTGRHYVGAVYAFRNTGERLGTVWPVIIEGNICYSSPALGDLDGDGDIELVVGSCRQSDGAGGKIHAWNLAGRMTAQKIVWGEFQHDSRRTGVAGDVATPSFVIAVLQNAALKKYLSLYVVASEKLMAMPDLVVGFTSSEGQRKPDQAVPLVQMDAVSQIYQADYIVQADGVYTFTVSGKDLTGNIGHSSKTLSIIGYQISSIQHPVYSVPAKFSLLPNYPNPFNPGTWIPYELPESADVDIEIHSASGQLIRSLTVGRRVAGSYTSRDSAAYWDGTDDSGQGVASGVYFCVLKAGSFKAVRKMILSK